MSADNIPEQVSRKDLGKVAVTLKEAGWTNIAIASRFETSEATIRRALREVGYVPPEKQLISKFDPDKTDYTVLEELHLECDDFIVLSDIHLPLADYNLLNRAVRDAQARGITTCIIAGDLLNMDTLSLHETKQREDGELSTEIDAANQFMSDLLDTFERVILTRGNHDERWARALGNHLRFAQSMRNLLWEVPADKQERLIILDGDGCYVHTSEGKWLFCHTRSYSRISTKVPSDIAMVEMCHVGAGHRHHFGATFAPNGFQVLELGGFFDGSRTEYLHYYKSNHPRWQKGWVVFEGGRIVAMPPLVGEVLDGEEER